MCNNFVPTPMSPGRWSSFLNRTFEKFVVVVGVVVGVVVVLVVVFIRNLITSTMTLLFSLLCIRCTLVGTPTCGRMDIGEPWYFRHELSS